jgi:hypothetical protein
MTMHVSGFRKTIALGALLGLILLAGCSRLPAYIQPRVEISDASRNSQVVSYRELTIADFRAPALPKDLISHKHDLNAHTSVAIRTRPEAKYLFSFEGSKAGQLRCGHAENLGFEAVMLPEKSWWSPTLAADKEAYVLQHEQVHFALMEVAARQLNRRAAVERVQLTACEADAEAVTNRISATIDRWMAESQQETLKQHGAFDEATSRLYALKVQQWWYDRAMKELLDLAEWQ